MSFRRVLLSLLAGVALLSAVFFVIRADSAQAINRQISYQGKLLDSSGAAVVDGEYQMKFSLYTAASGGTSLWSASGTVSAPTAIPVTVQNGLFTVMLGDSSASGQWQNTLDGIDWDSDALYLGVTIASDSEMSPRKRLGAVPQAFNAAQLQGMYASSSVSGEQSLFVLHQTENNAATGTRSALEVRTQGISATNDLLIRGVDGSTDTTSFSVNRLGAVTSTGNFAFLGSVTSTVAGSLSVWGNVSSSVLYAANATLASLSATTLNASGLVWVNASGTNTTSTNLYASLLGFGNAIGTNVTSTSLAVTGVATSTFGGSVSVAGNVSTTRVMVDDSLVANGHVTLGDSFASDFVYINGAVNSDIVSSNDEVLSLGSQTRRWLNGYFTNVTSTNASTTYLYVADAVAASLSATTLNAGALVWTNATGTNTTSTHLYASLFGFENAIGTNVTSTNLAVTGAATSTFLGSVSVAGNVSATRAVINRQFTVYGPSAFHESLVLGDVPSHTVQVNASIISSLVPGTDVTYNLGLDSLRWGTGYFANVSSTNATSTYFYTEQATIADLTATNVTSARLAVTDGGYFMPTSASNIEYLGAITATSAKQIALDGRLLYTVNTSTFQLSIFNFDTTSTPRFVLGGTVYAGEIRDFVLQDQISYILSDTGVLRLNRLYEGELGSISLAANANAIAVQGRMAYVTMSAGGYYIIDVADPTRPRILSQVTDAISFPSPRDIYVQDRYAYITNSDGQFTINDISNPLAPTVIGSVGAAEMVGSPGRMFVQGNYAYVVGGGLSIVDVFVPSVPVARFTAAGFTATDIVVDGALAYIAANDGVRIYNVREKEAPVLIQTLSVTNAQRLAIRGRRLFVTTGQPNGSIRTYLLPGIEAGSLQAHSLEAGVLHVLTNGRIGNKLDVEGGLSVGKNGIISSGALAVSSNNATSTIMGNLAVGTSTMDVALHSQFVMNGDDLFVGGNIGSASSVYTNGAFIAGTGSTYYAAGSITNTSGNLAVTTTGNFALNADSAIGLTAGAGVSLTAGSGSDINFTSGGTIRLAADGGTMIPVLDGSIRLGTESNRFDGEFRNTTTTNSTTTNAYITNAEFLNASGTNVTSSRLAVTGSGYFMPTSQSSIEYLGAITATSAKQIALDDRLLYVVNTSTFQTSGFEVDTTSTPRLALEGTVYANGIRDFALQDQVSYILFDTGVLRLDRLYEGELGSVTLSADAYSVFVQGKIAYVTISTGGYYIIDVADPTRPRILSQVTSGVSLPSPREIYVQDRYAYITNSDGTFTINNVANPSDPGISGSATTFAGRVFVQGNYAYVVGGGFSIIDVFVPTTPAIRFSDNSFTATDILVDGALAYIAANDGVRIYNVKAKESPVLIQTLSVTNAQRLAIRGRRLFVTTGQPNGSIRTYLLPGIEAGSLQAHSLEAGVLHVLTNGRIGNKLEVQGGLSVGKNGIVSSGALAVSAIESTSTIMGNLMVGTSTMDVAMHAQFVMNGNDLFVGGNIGSASSVYTNGAFIAGTGSTYYAAGSITNTSGNLAVTSTSNITFDANSGITLRAHSDAITLVASDAIKLSGTNVQPVLNGMSLGSEALGLGFNGYFRSVTSTGRVVQRLTADTPVAVRSNISTGGTSVRAVEVVGDYMYVLTSSTMRIYDVHDKANPVQLGSVSTGADNRDLVVHGERAYIVDFNRGNGSNGALYTVNVASKNAPFVASTLQGTGLVGPRAIEVQGRYAYIADSAGKLAIFDLAGATSTQLLSSVAAVGAQDLTVVGNYVYLAKAGGEVSVFDVTNPAVPLEVGVSSVGVSFSSGAIAAHGGYLYVSDQASAVVHAFIATSSPSLVGSFFTLGIVDPSNGLDIQGDYLYVVSAAFGFLEILDVSEPASPANIQQVVVDTDAAETLRAVRVSGRYAYVGKDSSADGVTIVDLGGTEVSQLQAHAAQVDVLEVWGNGRIGRDFFVDGGVTVAQGIMARGPSAIVASTTGIGTMLVNRVDHDANNSSWGAYVDRLLIGDDASATGTEDYASVITYDFGSKRAGLCLKSLQRGGCADADGLGATSIIADDAITANGFDLAEMYTPQGAVTTTDVLVFGVSPTTTQRSPGVAYDPRIMGVASTKPAFVLGIASGVPVALVGRVPTQVSAVNGPIAIGDPLTTSEYPGVAMKATKPGMILGYALEATNATSTIEVFIKTGYSAGSILGTDGRVARLTDDLVVEARETATASAPTQDSWGLTFRGSAWDGSSASQPSFTLFTQVTTATSSQLVIRNASSSNVFSVDQLGTATIAGDLVVGGHLYPSARGSAQQSKYIFVDDTSTSTQYIATNADGWQANDSYDFAERYYSPDKLDMGDLVIASDRGQFHVQRSLNENTMLMGIVSTRPAFVAGKPGPDTYPIALAGRVPTKVSTMNGAIKVGDPLAPSSIPGTAIKATKAGPIVGLALERYDLPTVGKIEVFVNPGWWGGNQEEVLVEGITQNQGASPTVLNADGSASYRGFALIEAGSKRVHVAYDSVLSYPNVQATPRGQVRGGWWTDNYTDIGFDILLNDEQTRDITFTWSVQGTPVGARVYRSDGTYGLVNPTTGETLIQTLATSTADVAPLPPQSSAPTPAPVAPPVTIVEPVVSPQVDEPAPAPVAPPAVEVPEVPVASEIPTLPADGGSEDSSTESVVTTPLPATEELVSDSSEAAPTSESDVGT